MGFFKSIGRAISGAIKGVASAVSSVIKSPLFQVIAPIALSFFLPGIGTAISAGLGLSAGLFGGAISAATLSAGLGSAAISGGMSILGGKSIGESLKTAAISGLTAGALQGATNFVNSSGGFSNLLSGADPASGAGQLGSSLNAGSPASALGSTGQINPNAASTFGQLNPNAGSTFGSITPNASNASSLLNPATPGVMDSLRAGEYGTALKTAAGKLIPDSTIGKIALGAGALGILGGGGGQQPEPMMAGDPRFGDKLQQMSFRTNPLQLNENDSNLNAYALAKGSVDPSSFNPATGRFERRSDKQGEFAWVRPEYYPPGANATPAATPTPTPVAAGGGRIPYFNSGGYLNHLAGGGQANAQRGGLIRGAGDGVSDSVPGTVGGQQTVRLAGGEFVVPARIVSEIGNGSSDAGNSRLEQMLKRINERRLKTRDFATDNKSYNLLPA